MIRRELRRRRIERYGEDHVRSKIIDTSDFFLLLPYLLLLIGVMAAGYFMGR